MRWPPKCQKGVSNQNGRRNVNGYYVKRWKVVTKCSVPFVTGQEGRTVSKGSINLTSLALTEHSKWFNRTSSVSVIQSKARYHDTSQWMGTYCVLNMSDCRSVWLEFGNIKGHIGHQKHGWLFAYAYLHLLDVCRWSPSGSGPSGHLHWWMHKPQEYLYLRPLTHTHAK